MGSSNQTSGGCSATDIAALYEISLAIGQSLDLKTNCERFLRTLMAKMNLAFAAVWLRRSCLAPSVNGPEVPAGSDPLDLAFANPAFRIRDTTIPPDHPLLDRLAREDAFSVTSSQKEFAACVAEHGISQGVLGAFALGRIGFLKVCSTARHEAFAPEELKPLSRIASKFAVSIEGCLAHQRLTREGADRKQAEAALKQSEEKYRRVVERAADGIAILQNGLVVFVNTRLARMAGQSPDEMLNLPFIRYVAPSELQRVSTFYKRRMAGEQVPASYETILQRADGTPVYVELNAGLITYEGQPADLVFVRDITERRKAELDRVRLAMAVEQTADAVVITTTDGTILYVNPAFERITGYTRQEALGQNPRLLKSGKQPAEVYRQMWQTITAGETWRGRFVNRRKDGSLFTCDAIITPTRDESGRVINFVSVQRDVTRELQMEEQYLQAQKMESIGRLAGGIAHDFNNIMTAVLGFGSMILDQLPDRHPLRHAVEQIVSAGERATNLTRQLLTFSRRQIMEVRILDLNSVITEMNQLLRRALGEDVELILDLDLAAGSVEADAGLLQQVVMNLAINARDAMPRGGRVTIRTQPTLLDEKTLPLRGEVKPGPYVLLALRDNGCGMPKEVLEHLFEPFFTTKPRGRGTGLGLATVYGIVRQCGGHIEVESEVNVGTEVRIWLPRVEQPSEELRVEVEEGAAGGAETILVAEDEDMVRDLTVHLLRTLGYRVLEARNGREALAVVEKEKGPIHLVLTDVVMPQMGGPELAEKLSAVRPDTRILFMSGFAESAILERGVAVSRVKLLQKPYTREMLAQKIRQVLDGT